MASLTILPASVGAQRATNAYQQVANGNPSVSDNSFGSMLGNALQSVVDTGNEADTKSAAALTGQADLTQVVTAVAQAQLALQTTNAIRDKVVSAYQDIMKMAI